jgi:hypothetical protein
MITPNIILGKGTPNQVEVSTTDVEKEYQRIGVSNVTLPEAETQILDLLRIEFRFIVSGLITDTDETKIENLFNQKNVFPFEYNGQDFTGKLEKLNITNSSQRENPELDVKFTLIRGTDLIE